jgi:hypothetical protein
MERRKKGGSVPQSIERENARKDKDENSRLRRF